MSDLFEKTEINNMILKNRFVRSATWEGLAEKDGSCTPQLTDMMVKLAEGGAGLIITGYGFVQSAGQAGPFQLGIHKDDFIPAFRSMTEAVNKSNGTIVLQLAHAGCQASLKLTGQEPSGPSALKINGKTICREMSTDDIAETVRAFGNAAARAKETGFDGIQIHAAHGYLLSQFLSPFYNRREDGYGGSIENRARILIESYRSIRNAVGNDFPVLVKINSEDFLEDGLKVEEMIEVSRMLEKEGIDAIELSGGTIHSDKKLRPVRPGIPGSEIKVYYLEAAKLFKSEISVPLMLVGGIRSFEVSERLLTEGTTDYISMSRSFIRDPDIVNQWESGKEIQSACMSDNACFRPGLRGTGIYCVKKSRQRAAGKW